jgi:hypothetical protein
MIIPFLADNIDNQVIKGYKKGVKENEGDQSEIRRNLPAISGLAKADHTCIQLQSIPTKANKYSWLTCLDNQIIKIKERAMPEKKTSNMLVRDIPIDVWERIDKLCRRNSMKRRDFVEQALRFFEEEQVLHFSEGKEAGADKKQGDAGQPPDIEGLTKDTEDLKREIKKDEFIQKIEQKIDEPDQKHKVDMDQLKPECDNKLIMKHLGSSDRASPDQEKKNDVLTTVYCWGLDAQSDR